jgi:3-oxoadipate enol-lactonase
MPTARINDIDIYYEDYGSGFPLVFAYGLGGNTGMWAGQIDAFSERYRFIAWDPRGHGGSDSPPENGQYGMQVSAEDLRGLLDHLQIERAFVGGLSMGGGIATRFAVSYPERVAALLIVDSASASGMGTKPEMRRMREKTIALAETKGMAAVADYIIEANPNLKSQAEASTEAYQRLRRMFLGLNAVGYANTVRALIDDNFSTDKLSMLSMPTLVLVGENDPALEAARLTHRNIPGSRLVVLPGAGHLSNKDCPEAFNAGILEFLEQAAI